MLGRDSNSPRFVCNHCATLQAASQSKFTIGARFFIVIRGMCKLLSYTSAGTDAKPDDEVRMGVSYYSINSLSACV